MLSPDRPITSKDIPAAAAGVLERIRERSPRVHCITNAVAQNFSANMLLAIGAIPSMTIAPEEVAQFAGRADALLVNLGTFDAERRTAAYVAIEVMTQQGKPWLLYVGFGVCCGLGAAHTGEALAILPLEDALALPEQPNLPGTIDQHPNWRRRLAGDAGTLLDDPAVARRLDLFARSRPRAQET
jgi:hypothetical protein